MDKYVKKKKIGEGSFGKALLVTSKTDGKEYVIKEINISKMKRKEREESKKEVAVLRKMRHPNIVSYQESFEAEGNLYIVMDYCDAGDLFKAINSRRGVLFPEDQIVDWFVQICLALKHVHDRKILHRDIKSQNIFLTRKNIIKLGDFGIARVLNSTLDLARTCIGTPYYLSPEICENKPYNNKSDIWALGCVLYEMCTLKHAFEAGNMKNLVLKIIRGSYPPVSPRYSYDLRTLLNQLFKRSPRERPSVNTILKKPFIQRRIEKFLSETQMQDEFRHTVLHRNAPAAIVGAGRPAVSVANKKPSPYQPARISNPAAKYGPSVGVRKPPAAAKRSADREKKAVDNKELEKKKKELIEKERERRNREIQLRLQQQRLAEKQRMYHINKAREAGWKKTLLSGGSNETAENDNKASDEPPKKEPRIEAQQPPQTFNKPLHEKGNYEQYHNYLDKLQANNQNAKPALGRHVAFRKDDDEDAALRQRIVQRPVSASAAEAARRGEMGKQKGAEAADRAKMVEEFLSRKREAAMNKARGQAQWMGQPVQPPPAEVLLPYGGGPGGAMRTKNAEEMEYLDRLKAIRMQNYQERRNMQQQVAAGGRAVKASLEDKDPRNNAEARRKKIEALKAQADEKAAKLKEQLEKHRREAYEKEKKQWEDHLARKKAVKNKEQKHLSKLGKGPAAPVIGLTGVLQEVGVASPQPQIQEPSKPDISNAVASEVQKEPEVDRKKWAGGDTALTNLAKLPLQETASVMEATSAQDVVIRNQDATAVDTKGGGGFLGGGPGPSIGGGIPPAPAGCRKKWGAGRGTAVVSALEKVDIASATMTINKNEAKPPMGVTIVKADDGKSPPRKLPIAGGTVVIAKADEKKATDDTDSADIETIDASDKSEERKEKIGETQEPSEPKTAWDNKSPGAPKSPTAISSSLEVKEETVKRPKSPRSPRRRRDLSKSEKKPTAESSEKKEETEAEAKGVEEKVTKDEGKSEEKEPKIPDKKDEKEEEDEKPKSPTKEAASPEEMPPKEKALLTQVELEDEEEDESSDEKQGSSGGEDEGLFVGLTTGNFDTDARILRSCSLPDLSKLFRTTLALNPFFEVEQQTMAAAATTLNFDMELEDIEDQMVRDGGEDQVDGGDEVDGGIVENGEDGEEQNLSGNEEDDEEEDEDYQSFVESLKHVLEAADKADEEEAMENDTPSPKSLSPVGAEGGEDEDDEEGTGVESKPINEDWDSGDGDGSEEDNVNQGDSDTESVYCRLEETRLELEEELGCEDFLKAYKTVQAIHEDEDESIDEGTKIVGNILGQEKEHLYTKILQLVMADGAYTEDND